MSTTIDENAICPICGNDEMAEITETYPVTHITHECADCGFKTEVVYHKGPLHGKLSDL